MIKNQPEAPVGPEQFRAHAANLDAVRSLLGEVHAAQERAGQDVAAFGSVAGWLLSGMHDRHVRQQELIAYVEETMFSWADLLRRVADGDQELKTIVRHDDDVATRDGTPVVEGPEHSFEGLQAGVTSRVEQREWIAAPLADAAPVAEFAAPVDDWYAALRVGGLEYALTHIEPLRHLIDGLAGLPRVVACDADGWEANGRDLLCLSVLLRQCVAEDMPRRDRLDVRSYHARMAYNVDALLGLAEVAASMAVITRHAGELVGLTTDIVRGVIGDLFARVIAWVTGVPAGIPVPSAGVQFGIVVVTAWRIHAYIDALETSIGELSRSVDG
ncbi:hypothetical protein ACFYON_24130 [Micromonospora sp. NPDC005686]|uniref:hypothetical protein n=1 Tax=unclassified Micromonospora TaxID=2617518 RepID=UPI003699B65F